MVWKNLRFWLCLCLNCRESAPNPKSSEVILLQFVVLDAPHSLCPAEKECLFFVVYSVVVVSLPSSPPTPQNQVLLSGIHLAKEQDFSGSWPAAQTQAACVVLANSSSIQKVLLNKLSDKAWFCFTVFKFLGELFRLWKCSSSCICVKLWNYKTQPLVSLGLRWLKYQKDLHIEVFYTVSQYWHRYV